jgi:hypothetical protein
MAPVEVTSYPHLDIRDWLTRLELENYVGRLCRSFIVKISNFGMLATQKFVFV